MKFSAYLEWIKDYPVSALLEYRPAVFWVHPERLPLALISLGTERSPVIRVPGRTVNPFGHTEKHFVPVTAFRAGVFQDQPQITDIVLPPTIRSIPAGAFAGCTGLRRITIPKTVTVIHAGTFAGCSRLSAVYYEGTPEEWAAVRIVHQKHEVEFGTLTAGTPVQEVISERLVHLPGNEPLLAADICCRCVLPELPAPEFSLRADGKEITDLFTTL